MALLSVHMISSAQAEDHSLSLAQAVNLSITREEPGILARTAQAEGIRAAALSQSSLPDPKLKLGLANLPYHDFNFNQDPMTQIKLGLHQDIPSRTRRRLIRERGLESGKSSSQNLLLLDAVPKATTVRGYSFFGDSYVYILFEDGAEVASVGGMIKQYQVVIVRLGDMTRIRVMDGPGMIRSENARLNGWVYVDIKEGDIGRYIARAQAIVDKEMTLPPGYALRWSGQYEYMERAKERLVLIIPVTLLLIIFILYLAFRRVADVVIILISLPLALSGGLWLLYLLDFHLSIAVAVGFIALSGVAVEMSVVMILFLNNALQAVHDDKAVLNRSDIRVAITEGALMRLRPLLMTVVTIFAGLLPIMMGTGSEVMQRIAAPMVGGMASATLLTLVVIPAVFYLWHGRILKAM